MIAIVTLVFSLCWLPITLYIMSANIISHKSPFLYYFKVIANSFAYLNSAINPILYAFLNRSFRNNCGSLFIEPSCSLFCGEDYPPSQTQQQQKFRKCSRSTQIDRFSYQSTNPQSASLAPINMKKKVSIISNVNQLSPDVISHNDFSDGDCEISETECVTQVPIQKNTYSTQLSTVHYQPMLPVASDGSRTYTTVL